MAYQAALKVCTESDLKRFACCYLNTNNGVVDWDAAAAQWSADVKAASFKTMTTKAARKAILAAENGEGGADAATGGEGEGDEGTVKTPAKKGGKKTPAKKRGADDEEGGGEKPKPKKAKGGKKAKGKADAEDLAEAEKAVKVEEGEEAEYN